MNSLKRFESKTYPEPRPGYQHLILILLWAVVEVISSYVTWIHLEAFPHPLIHLIPNQWHKIFILILHNADTSPLPYCGMQRRSRKRVETWHRIHVNLVDFRSIIATNVWLRVGRIFFITRFTDELLREVWGNRYSMKFMSQTPQYIQ